MCVIFFAYNAHPDYPLILLANRDEFYDRPTAKAAWWKDDPKIFGGRDLVGDGTWLGITKAGRFAAVTNYRDTKAPTGHVSRGKLVADYLAGEVSAESYLQEIASRPSDFSGFNLLAGEFSRQAECLFYYSNRGAGVQRLDSGVYGLSNHLLDTPWPKVLKGKQRLEAVLRKSEIDKGGLFEILTDRTLADDGDLPDTGIGYEKEKLLSSIFIETPIYGTRCSTVVTAAGPDFEFDFEEHVFV